MVEAEPLVPLTEHSTPSERLQRYIDILERLKLMLEDEPNFIAAMATVACEIHQCLSYSHWTGFYFTDPSKPGELVIGPYQGSLACLRIPFSRGVCGAAAKTQNTQLVPNVHEFPGHIACASSTLSEVVVPVISLTGSVIAVLDLDSDLPSAFTEVDASGLEEICAWMGEKWSDGVR